MLELSIFNTLGKRETRRFLPAFAENKQRKLIYCEINVVLQISAFCSTFQLTPLVLFKRKI